MRWPRVKENEGGEGQGLNVERGALMCGGQGGFLGEVVQPGSSPGEASRHPPPPSLQPAGRESSPRTGPLALPSSPQPAENTGGPGPLPVPGMGFVTALSLVLPG